MRRRELEKLIERAKERYPIGTKYIPLDGFGNPLNKEQVADIEIGHHWQGIYANSHELVYHFGTGKWAEVINKIVINKDEPEINVIL